MNWIKQRHRLRTALWLSCVAGLICLAPVQAIARDTVRICNSSETRTMNVATVNNYWYGGQELWRESGWNTVGPRTCEVISKVRPFHAVGYAFQVVDGDDVFNPFVKFRTFTEAKALRMCVHRNEAFSYSRKLSEQVGKDCPIGAYRAIVSLFISGGNKFDETILNLDADVHVRANNRVNPSAVISVEEFNENKRKNTYASVNKAAKRFMQSCAGGRANACYVAGNLFFEGKGVAQNFERAHDLYIQGCETGSANACYRAGELFSDSRSKARDDTLAKNHYDLACKAGLTKGCNKLNGMAD